VEDYKIREYESTIKSETTIEVEKSLTKLTGCSRRTLSVINLRLYELGLCKCVNLSRAVKTDV